MPVSGQSFYFDTLCMISIYDIDTKENKAERAQDVIDESFALCAEYEGLLSKTKEGSDIYRINNAGGSFTACDERTVDAIKKGLEFSGYSGGSFDITIGALTGLWDFHADEPHLPGDEEIREAAGHTDHKKVIIRNNEVKLEDPEAVIDLGGMAKGYIADRISEYMEEQGVNSAVISLGGNIVCIGSKTVKGKEEAFKVGVETPYSDRSEISASLDMRDETAVTSGVYERYFETGGKKYHHILDPKTGYPADTDLLSVTVVSDKGRSCECDALSTICLLKGKEEGMKLIEEKEGFEGIFIGSDGDKKMTQGLAGRCRIKED